MDTSKTIDIGGRFNISLNVDISDNIKEFTLNTKHRITDIKNGILQPINQKINDVKQQKWLLCSKEEYI